MTTQIYFDGGSHPHAGGGFAACYGWTVKQDGRTIKEGKRVEKTKDRVGSSTAEFTALIKALEQAIVLGLHQSEDDVIVRGDCQSVIHMAAGIAPGKAESCLKFNAKVQHLAAQFKQIKFEWVPRELNREADLLGRAAYRECDDVKRRHSMITKVNIQSRRAFGALYDKQIAEAWRFTLTGKKQFSQMNTLDLRKLLQGIKHIPAIIAGYTEERAPIECHTRTAEEFEAISFC